MELEKELQESIKKNLPQQVGEVLKQRLEQADKDAAELKRLSEKNEELARRLIEQNSAIQEYQKFDARNGLLESRENEVENKEKLLEIEQLKYELQAEKDKTIFSQNVAMGLVRNVEYRKNIFDSENLGGLPVIDRQGYSHYPVPTNKQHESTERAE